jgi:hypothetical protein
MPMSKLVSQRNTRTEAFSVLTLAIGPHAGVPSVMCPRACAGMMRSRVYLFPPYNHQTTMYPLDHLHLQLYIFSLIDS